VTITLVDTHAHLDMEEFDSDRLNVIYRAKEAGVKSIISVGIDLASSHEAINLSESNEVIFATVGLHPHNAKEVTQQNILEMEKLAKHPKVVAIGELGLDYHYQPVDADVQRRLMRRQLELANRLELPVIIHSREAEEDILPILIDWNSNDQRRRNQALGVIHCFSGNLDIAQKYIEMGFYISLGAYIGYPSARHLYNVIRDIPLDKLLIETDCPFLPPQKYRGKRNEPSYILFTLQALADITGNTRETIARQTTENANQLFKLKLKL
jgi:TatD DNase family protein